MLIVDKRKSHLNSISFCIPPSNCISYTTVYVYFVLHIRLRVLYLLNGVFSIPYLDYASVHNQDAALQTHRFSRRIILEEKSE